MDDELGIEQVNEFYRYLRYGKAPDVFSGLAELNLSAKQATSIIYVLQHLQCIPDHYEHCDHYEEYFDSEAERMAYIERTGERLGESAQQRHSVYTCCMATEETFDYHDGPGRMLVLTKEMGELQPGLYRINEWPFYGDGMIESYIFDYALTRIGDVPEGADTGDYAIGFLCETEEQKIIHAECGEH